MSDPTVDLPRPISASLGDLPTEVGAVLATAVGSPDPGRTGVTSAADYPFAWTEWGATTDPAVLLVHGVGASAAQFWRIGPALAASGRRIVAPDLPGHGRTGHWRGRHLFRDTAADLAAFIRAADLDERRLKVIGHSWGAMTVAGLPAVGLRPERLVLVDPPAVPQALIARMLEDPVERPFDDLSEAVAFIQATYPGWTDGDIFAKAEGLTQLDLDAVRAVLLDNGDWDGGLADLTIATDMGVPAWLIRGEPAQGGYVAEAWLPSFAAVIGADHILTIDGGSHSPHRDHPEATVSPCFERSAS